MIDDSYIDSEYDLQEMRNIREFVDGLDLLIKDIDDFNNSSYDIVGSFGQAMAYSSNVCKDNIEMLKKFADQNLTSAMNDVNEYDSNYEKIKEIIVPIAGDISKVVFLQNGSISIPSVDKSTIPESLISQAESLNRRNQTIKDRLEALTNEKINK